MSVMNNNDEAGSAKLRLKQKSRMLMNSRVCVTFYNKLIAPSPPICSLGLTASVHSQIGMLFK